VPLTRNLCSCGIQVNAYLFLNLYGQGLRAFLPKAELVKRATSFTELKENVSCKPWNFPPIHEKNNIFLIGMASAIFLFYYLLFVRSVD